MGIELTECDYVYSLIYNIMMWHVEIREVKLGFYITFL